MTVENLSGDVRNAGTGQAVSYGHAGALKVLASRHHTVDASASATSTYSVGVVSLGDRISTQSRIFFDDLASAGSPTFDIGLFAIGDATNFTSDDDALNDGIDAATNSSVAGLTLLKDNAANGGKYFWEILGLSSNPGGFAEIKITLKDAAVNVGGDMYCEVIGTHDG